jgi:ArsR family transcriptional regulator, virulence genes transcriptional regulator
VQDAVNEIDAIQASLLRALASPQRLRLLHLLGDHPKEVNELARELELGQATVSQHLAAMRGVGLVESNRDGRSVRYRLTDQEILVACDLMRQVIGRRLSALGSLAAAAGYAPTDPRAGTQPSPTSPSTQVTHP